MPAQQIHAKDVHVNFTMFRTEENNLVIRFA